MKTRIIKPEKIIKKYRDREIYLGTSFFKELNQIISKYPNNLVITDQIIYEQVAKDCLKDAAEILPAQIKASKAIALEISHKLQNFDYAIAIGSGTINDLVKYAAHQANKPYIVFATAPSMNGYFSENASLITDNIKQSHKANPPLHAYFDLDILANAPTRLIQSGLGDSICSTICRADWLLSHYLLDTNYDELPFDLTYELENKLYQQSSKLLDKDKEAVALLTEILIMSSLGMTYCGSSEPASQGEHMLAHYYELLDPEISHQSFHGEQIAVTSQHMLKIQEKILKSAPPTLKARTLPKLPDGTSKAKPDLDITHANQQLKTIWPELGDAINQKYRSQTEILNTLKQARIKTTPVELGWNQNIYKTITNQAFLTRDRFTFLDLEFYS